MIWLQWQKKRLTSHVLFCLEWFFKNGVLLVVVEGGRFLVLFLAATRWKTLQTNMKECVVLFHTEFFPPKFFFFFYLYIFHQRDGDLGTGPISWLLCKCDRASCERKRIFPPVGVGVGGLVCVATTFAVQLLTEWVSDAMSLLLIVPPDELILYLLSSLQLFTLIRFVLLSCVLFLTKFHLCRSSSEVRGGVSMSGSSDVTPLATVEPFVVR